MDTSDRMKVEGATYIYKKIKFIRTYSGIKYHCKCIGCMASLMIGCETSLYLYRMHACIKYNLISNHSLGHIFNFSKMALGCNNNNDIVYQYNISCNYQLNILKNN